MQNLRQGGSAERRPEIPNAQAARPWAIRRSCLVLSLVLAGVAEVLLLMAPVIALIAGNRNFGVLVLSALPFGWLLFYGATYLLLYGIAVIDQAGPFTERLARWARWERAILPAWACRTLDAWYRLMPNFFLVAVPAVVALMALVVVWAAATVPLN